MLTQEYLKRQLSYDPETGLFTRIRANGNAHIGDIAGNTNSISGYHYISLKGHPRRAHRLVWLYLYGAFPEGMIDHINGIKNDNRLANLRECNRAQNALNCKVDVRNKFGLKGVRQIGNRFCARATKDKKEIHLGCFATAVEASQRYIEFVKSYSPEFVKGI